MKKYIRNFRHSIVLVFCFLSILQACTDDDSNAFVNDEEVGEVRPIGETIGDLYTQELGAQGGTISADGGNIIINVPAGALDENVQIGIQEIETTNRAGIGKSYRLTPHGQEFNEPIEISFKYDEGLVAAVQTLGIAFQDEKRVWNYVVNPVINTNDKTVTVESTHFSDWSIMSYAYVIPMGQSIKTGESIELRAVRFVMIDDDDDLLAPLVPNHKYTPIRTPVDLDSKFVKEWTLAGDGNLSPNGSRATYTAPQFIPTNNPVAVSLELKTSVMQVFLISNITIQGGDVEFRIDGGNLIKLDAVAVQLSPGHYGISSTSTDPGDGVLKIFWSGGVGTHPFTPAVDFDTNWGYTGPVGSNAYYGDTYAVGETQEPHISPGGITITSMGEVGGYVEGTFLITKSGHVDFTIGQVGIVPIEGSFRVRRAF